MIHAMSDDEYGDQEAKMRYQATLRAVLSAPPQPKTKKVGAASPKKRGRPPKAKPSESSV